MEQIKQTFANCAAQSRPAFVTYVTAGYPSPQETVSILLSLEAGGTDVLEVGIPFTDPIADGPTIQRANTQALLNNVTIESSLEMIRESRKKGLKAPVLLMGVSRP